MRVATPGTDERARLTRLLLRPPRVMISAMARYRHTVALDAVPRGWFDDRVAVAHRTLGAYLDPSGEPIDPGFRLVEGTALRPGARYADGEGALELDLLEWGPRTDTAARLRYVDRDVAVTATGRLSTPADPRTATTTAELRRLPGRRSPSLRAERVEAHADLARWGAGGGPALTVRAGHPLYRASFDLTVTARGDRWAVRVTARVTGRTALRPLTALVLLCARRRIRAGFAAHTDRLAAAWNSALPALLAMDPGQLRDLIAAELTATRVRLGAVGRR